MKRRWGFLWELLGFLGVMVSGLLLMGETTGSGRAIEFVYFAFFLMVGWWEFAFRFLWLNWIESPELTKGFSSERIDRPIPFTFRCSEMRFFSPLSPKELHTALEQEIASGNEQLVPWRKEENGVSWKAKWKIKWTGEHLRLQCFRSAKGKGAWERVHGAIFFGQLIPCENGGSILQGHFGWSIPDLFFIPAIFAALGSFGGFVGEHGALFALSPFILKSILENMGRGSYGVDSLTVETQKALISFFGEPELLE